MQTFYALKNQAGACCGFMTQAQRDAWTPVEGITLIAFDVPDGSSFDTIADLAEAAVAAS